MAWIQVHQNLKDHRKLYDAADDLEIAPPYMLGMLVSFWLWALDNAPSGRLDGITARTIARASQYNGAPEDLLEALINAGFIDENEYGILEIHDWHEYAGKLIDQRKAEKERSQRRRNASGRPADDQQTTGGRPAVDRRTTVKRPADDRQTTGGRVEKSRVEKSIYISPLTPQGSAGQQEDEEAKKEALQETRFAAFWLAYPKKTGKQYAQKAWNKIKPDAALYEKIMQAVEGQKRSDQWRRENGRYIPNPATWLNGGYWDNEEVNQDAENRTEPGPAAPAGASKTWGTGFKAADDFADE